MDKKFETTLGGATIVVRRRDDFDYEGRRQYSWRITLPNGRTFKARDLWTGANGMGDRGARNMTATLLGYLDAFAEAQRYEGSENRDLFPKGMREWATQNSDEIAMARFEIENPEPKPKGVKKKARELGRERGKAAASWVFDGNTPKETYETFVRLYDNGDPAIEQFDTMTGWLSGEYADQPSPTTLARDLGLPTETDEDQERLTEACDIYEEAADAAYWAELERVARLQVGGAE